MPLCTELADQLIERMRTTDYMPTATEAVMMKRYFSTALSLEMRRLYDKYETTLNKKLFKMKC